MIKIHIQFIFIELTLKLIFLITVNKDYRNSENEINEMAKQMYL